MTSQLRRGNGLRTTSNSSSSSSSSRSLSLFTFTKSVGSYVQTVLGFAALLYVIVSVGLADGRDSATVHSSDQKTPSSKFVGVTCWTCDKSDNHGCNKGAPNRPCPVDLSVCKTQHRFNSVSKRSHSVLKFCSSPSNCTMKHVGCRNISFAMAMECTSCCDYPFCNEEIPIDQSTAITLSSVLTSQASSSRYVIRPEHVFIYFTASWLTSQSTAVAARFTGKHQYCSDRQSCLQLFAVALVYIAVVKCLNVLPRTDLPTLFRRQRKATIAVSTGAV